MTVNSIRRNNIFITVRKPRLSHKSQAFREHKADKFEKNLWREHNEKSKPIKDIKF